MCRPSSTSSTASGLGVGVGSGTITASVRALMPNHPACTEALSLAKSSLPPSILYHSFRVFLYAQAFMRIFQDDPEEHIPSPHPSPPPSPSPKQPPSPPAFPDYILFVGCILHDIGVATQYDSIPERFEVVGADVAARILRNHLSSPSQAVQSEQIKDLWLALSLHTSPGIAERIGGVVRAIRLAVRADFGSYPLPPPEMFGNGGDSGALNVMKWGLPRLEIEKELGDAVVRQALLERRKAPASSWPGDLMRARDEDPDWEGVNKGF
ncbi:hypothetical protein V8F20_006265 [Naviculisporaceae sp. PSN 640]